jgi:hypothetical protein
MFPYSLTRVPFCVQEGILSVVVDTGVGERLLSVYVLTYSVSSEFV